MKLGTPHDAGRLRVIYTVALVIFLGIGISVFTLVYADHRADQQDRARVRDIQRAQDSARRDMCAVIELIIVGGGQEPPPGPAGDRARAISEALVNYRDHQCR